jgi:hypothetical protein
MTARHHQPAADRGALVDPIGATPPWQVTAEAAAGPHQQDWAGPAFTKPEPKPHTGNQARSAPPTAEAAASMTAIPDGPATSVSEHRRAATHSARQTGTEGRTACDRQHQRAARRPARLLRG